MILVTDTLSTLDDPFQIIWDSHPVASKIVEMFGDEDGASGIFIKIVGTVMEVRRQARPSGPPLVIDVVAALFDLSSIRFRLLAFESFVMKILIHTQTFRNAHRIHKSITIPSRRDADEPVSLFKSGSHVARGTQGSCAVTMERVRRKATVVLDDMAAKLHFHVSDRIDQVFRHLKWSSDAVHACI